MKTLYLLRHAETENHAPRDRDRRLTPRGEADMAALAQKLRDRGALADYVLCSPAQRTRDTARLVLPAGAPVTYPENLYNVGVDILYETLKAVPDHHNNVWLINHNPAIHELAAFLAAGMDPRLTRTYAPGTLTILSCDIARWRDLAHEGSPVADILIP